MEQARVFYNVRERLGQEVLGPLLERLEGRLQRHEYFVSQDEAANYLRGLVSGSRKNGRASFLSSGHPALPCTSHSCIARRASFTERTAPRQRDSPAALEQMLLLLQVSLVFSFLYLSVLEKHFNGTRRGIAVSLDLVPYCRELLKQAHPKKT